MSTCPPYILALLDDATQRTGGLLAHVTYLPSGGADGLRVNSVATLARIVSFNREEVGARVEVIGVGRGQSCRDG